MRKVTPIILTAFALGTFFCDFAFAEETGSAEAQTSVAPSGSIYSYDQNNAPEVFFFPKEKARWDGANVTMSEWYMLTELQKEKFITEYLKELQSRHQVALDVTGTDYLKALNVFSAYSNDKTLREPSTKFIDIILSGQGKVAEKDQPKSGGQ